MFKNSLPQPLNLINFHNNHKITIFCKVIALNSPFVSYEVIIFKL